MSGALLWCTDLKGLLRTWKVSPAALSTTQLTVQSFVWRIRDSSNPLHPDRPERFLHKPTPLFFTLLSLHVPRSNRCRGSFFHKSKMGFLVFYNESLRQKRSDHTLQGVRIPFMKLAGESLDILQAEDRYWNHPPMIMIYSWRWTIHTQHENWQTLHCGCDRHGTTDEVEEKALGFTAQAYKH